MIQATIQIVGTDASPRNVVDLIDVQGPARLPTYRVLSTETTNLGESEAIQITYVYVETEENPFLESIPIVVQGIDLVVIRKNQAIIFTYRDAQQNFEKNRFYFDNFLATVEF